MKTPILNLCIIFFISFSVTILTAIKTPELREKRNLPKMFEVALATFALLTLLTAFAGSIYLIYFKP
jgi:uncharacterized membrane protein